MEPHTVKCLGTIMEKYTAVVRQGRSDLQAEQPRWNFNRLITVAQEYGSMSLHQCVAAVKSGLIPVYDRVVDMNTGIGTVLEHFQLLLGLIHIVN